MFRCSLPALFEMNEPPTRKRRAASAGSSRTPSPERKKKATSENEIDKITVMKTPSTSTSNETTTKHEKPLTQRRQSPIDIRSENVKEDPETCKVDSLNISYTKGDCCEVETSAGGFKVNVHKKCSTTFAAAHLPAKYELAQFHAHWCKDGSCGSEHLLDGKAMSAEVHFVFWNTTYGSFCEAVDKDDGLAVIGVFLKEGEHSSNYQPLLDCIKKARESETTVALPEDFELHSLLPPVHDREFATYLGSLTTPPYTESVIWTVLIHPVEVSKEQLDVLRAIVPSNWRECQELCERSVRCSRSIKG